MILKKLIAFILVWFFVFAAGTAAQEAQAPPPAKIRLAGVVRTAEKIPVPGATVKLVQLATGQGWVSWTDENGKYAFPGMAAGRYRIEVQQLGFDAASVETEFKTPAAESDVTLQIAALAAAEKPTPPKTEAPQSPAATESAKPEAAKTSQAPPQNSATPPTKNAPAQNATPGQQTPGQRPGQAGQRGQQPNMQAMADAMRQRMGNGGFQQVDPTGQASGVAPEMGGQIDAGPLGEAASADALAINGTVGRGAAGNGMMMFGGLDPSMMAAMAGAGGFGNFGGMPGGAGGFPGGAPGMGGGGGEGMTMIFMGGGPGGAGGAPRGGQGQGGQRQGQGGQRQQQARGQQGGQTAGDKKAQTQLQQTGPGGMDLLWGMQRMMRLAANRFRFGFNERYSNSVWNARPYSLTSTNPSKVAHYQQSLGFNAGGPLRIPHIYDGREKTFFFANYQMTRNRNPVDTFATVPTQLERGGDFTAQGLQLFDPLSNLSGPRTAFGSVIPGGRLDSAAVGLLAFIPLPTQPGTAQNFHLQGRVPQSSDSFSIRVLHTISQKLNLQVSYGMNSSRSQSILNYPALRGTQSSLGQNVSIGLTQQYTQRLMHDSRITWSRNSSDSLNLYAFKNDIAGTLGITGISTSPINFGVPQIGFTNFTDLNDPVPALRHNQTFRYTDTISLMHAKHTIRGGGEVRRMQQNTLNDPTARGSFAFTGLMTSQLDAAGNPIPGTGNDFADFLLGLPQSTNVRFGSSNTYFRSWGFNLYAQDDWRVHPRFTLTYGLRYELQTPPIELFNHLTNLDMNNTITAVATVLPDQTSPFNGHFPRALVHGDYNNWSPRLAIAWRVPLKATRGKGMTVRAGYGMFHNLSIYNQLAASMANQPPFAQAQTRQTTIANLLTLQNGFPPVTPGNVPNTIAVDPFYKVGYAQMWNVATEAQLSQVYTIEFTYTGTKGTHLDLLRSPNRALPTCPLCTDSVRRIPNAPGFTYDTSGASSIYHALQVRVQRRLNKGMMVMGTYTYGKSIDNASSIGGGAQVVVQNDNNFAAERGLSTFDMRHQFRSLFVWEMPFGERKRWAKRGWQANVFGNWSLNGNFTWTSGNPYTARLLGAASNNSGTGNNFSERPDQVGDPNLPSGQRTPLHFFDTTAFALPAPGVFGDAGRNTITGPGTLQFNMSAGKFMRFGKDNQRRIDFRWEATNVFNTPSFTGLATALGSSNFGRVSGARQMRNMDLQMRVNF
jgi:carboxypeptidase family protein/TonB-dependent receptor-like protein